MEDNMPDYYLIGQNIRKFRKAKRMSQESLAERIGISTTHMSHIETGNTKLSLPVLIELSQILEVSTDSIIFGDSGRDAELPGRQIAELLESSSTKQQRIISEVVSAVKTAMVNTSDNGSNRIYRAVGYILPVKVDY